MAQKSNEKLAHEVMIPSTRPRCGVIMPISSTVDYPESHWVDVYSIVRDAVSDAGLDANLVSYADESTFIHKTIVQNLYDNPIVICDVSAKNPNVMFELGLRLAFDKPTIVIKDDATTYSFDTGPIEHLPYPKDLRFARIVEFKKKLAEKVTATLKASENHSYSTFLKHFGKFTIAKLDETEVTTQEFVIDALKGIQHQLALLNSYSPRERLVPNRFKKYAIETQGLDVDSINLLKDAISRLPGVDQVVSHQYDGESRLLVDIAPETAPETMLFIHDRLRELQSRARSN